ALPRWGAPRIHGELLTVGIEVSQATVAKYMVRHRKPPSQTWRISYVERLIGSIRRECLDHIIVLHESGLRRILKSYFQYYERSRTHLALDKDAPVHRAVQSPDFGRVIELPQVGGLHHRYGRRAA